MPKLVVTARQVLMLSIAVVVGCGGDRSVLVAPLPGDAVIPRVGIVDSLVEARVAPVERAVELPGDLTWSFDADPEGTFVRHASTGLSISIPKGAIAVPTRITVAALRGKHFAYRFGPHGLQFAAPVELKQSLSALKVKRDVFGFPRLIAGYFPEDSLTIDAVTGTARVEEVLPIWIDAKGKTLRLEIRHFSGYTVASAMNDDDRKEPR
jgi:hypothetical protein